MCDLAKLIGPNGTVIGIEPQPALASVPRQRLAENAQCSFMVIEASAEKLPSLAETPDFCIEQTVLIHLPQSAAMRALQEMFCVVKPGGCLISIDHDADTWAIDHPDRDLTRAIVHFNSDQRFADGWRGRQLRSMFVDVGLRDVEIHPWVHVDTRPDSYLFVLAGRICNAAAEANFISGKEKHSWMRKLREQANVGRFFSSINFNVCRGVKPPTRP